MKRTTDGDNIQHLETCPGGSCCDALLEWYASCDRCGKFCHKSTMVAVFTIKTDEMIALCENCKNQQQPPA